MSEPLPAEFVPIGMGEPQTKGFRLWLRQFENFGVTAALLAMMLLPVLESVLRKTLHTGISGATLIVQQFTFIVGMLGGAIAARDGRLLALSALTTVLHGRVKTAATIFSQSFAAAVSVFLCLASVQFVRSEIPTGEVIAYGIKTWVVQLLLPIGFGVIAARLWWHSARTWRSRAVALALLAAFIAAAVWLPVPVEKLKWPALGLLLLATVLGAPVFTTLGGAAMILFWADGTPIAAVPLTHYSLVVNPSLPTIPLFTLAGYFLAEGGASHRLVRVFNALFGQIRGGPAIVTALVCAFFTSFTGGSGVTILALGGVLMPVLIAAKYRERTALGLLTGAGSLGILFPPCLPLILYAIIASQAKASITIQQMFLGGLLPGFLMVALAIWWGVAAGPKLQKDRRPFDFREAWRAVWVAKWELLLPVVALVALFGGFATPVEAAAVTALYAFIVETVVYRDLKMFGGRASRLRGRSRFGAAKARRAAAQQELRPPGEVEAAEATDAPTPPKTVLQVVADCGLLVGGVLLILGVALGFTQYLVDAQVPDHAVAWATTAIKSKWLFLLGLNVVLLFVGGLVEIYAAIVVVVPLLVPLGLAFGIDPIHLGIIFLANMELGFLAPPVGLNLLLASYRFNKPMVEVMRAVLPMLGVQFIGVLLITYVPPLTTFLPRLFGR
jgi:TRAP-type C4-dicarboxylate transport system permease large subunit/TRAP-type C4-dicarboxylate transport system permease small subunit